MQAIVLCAFVCFTAAQHIFDHPCRNRPVLKNFDLQKYVAHKWYEIARFEAPFQKHCNCATAVYTINDDGTVGVKNCCSRHQRTDCSIGKAVLGEPEQQPLEGKLSVSFEKPNNNTNYFILSTDYENYSIVYCCKNIPEDKSVELAWLLSSKPHIDESVQATVDGLLEEHFEKNLLYFADQSEENCALHH